MSTLENDEPSEARSDTTRKSKDYTKASYGGASPASDRSLSPAGRRKNEGLGRSTYKSGPRADWGALMDAEDERRKDQHPLHARSNDDFLSGEGWKEVSKRRSRRERDIGHGRCESDDRPAREGGWNRARSGSRPSHYAPSGSWSSASTAAAYAHERAPSSMVNDDGSTWVCASCGVFNYADRTHCHMRRCGVPRPPRTSSWSIVPGAHEVGETAANEPATSSGWETQSPALSSSAASLSKGTHGSFSWGDQTASTSSEASGKDRASSADSASQGVEQTKRVPDLSASVPVGTSAPKEFPQLSASAEVWEPTKPAPNFDRKRKNWRGKKPQTAPTSKHEPTEVSTSLIPVVTTSAATRVGWTQPSPARTEEAESASSVRAQVDSIPAPTPPRRSVSLPPSKPVSPPLVDSTERVSEPALMCAPVVPKHADANEVHAAPGLHPYHQQFLISQQSLVSRAHVRRLALEFKAVLVGIAKACTGNFKNAIDQLTPLIDVVCKEVNGPNSFIEPILLEPTFQPVVVGDHYFETVRAERTCRPTNHAFAEGHVPHAQPPQRTVARAMGRSSGYNGIAPLSTSERAVVQNAVTRGGPGLAATFDGLHVSYDDLKRLTTDPKAWINDSVIDFYLRLVQRWTLTHQDLPFPPPRCLSFSSKFYSQLTGGGRNYDYGKVQRWNKDVDIFSFEKLLLPVYLNQREVKHWLLVVVDMRYQCLEYHDGLGGSDSGITRAILRFLGDEYQAKRGRALNIDNWRVFNPSYRVLGLANAEDCGVFVCRYAALRAMDACIDFSSKDADALRERLVLEIIRSKLDVYVAPTY